MNILICDDDRQYVDLLNKYVTSFFINHNIPDYNIYKYFSGEDVVKDMKYIDIAFLDVEMDGINGIEVGRRLRQKNPDIVIFIITSYMGYLDEAMDQRVFRYINKPIEKPAIMRGMQKAIALSYKKAMGRIVITVDNREIVVNQNSIICVVATGHSKYIYTDDGNIYENSESMAYWKDKLDDNMFVQTNKSYIVNISYVKSISDGIIELNGIKEKAVLSRGSRKELKTKLLMYHASQE